MLTKPPATSPQHDAEDIAEAARRLARSTRDVADPSDLYWVLNDLAAAVPRLQQVAIQIATAHGELLPLAHDHHGRTAQGHAEAITTAAHLRQSADLLGQVHFILDLASTHAGNIAWYEPASATPVTAEPTPGTEAGANDHPRHAMHPKPSVLDAPSPVPADGDPT